MLGIRIEFPVDLADLAVWSSGDSCQFTCDENIPPECIAKVIDMDDQTLYRDDYLSSVAPGGRPANLRSAPRCREQKSTSISEVV